MDEEIRNAWKELQASEGTNINAARKLLRILERLQEDHDALAGIQVWICRYSHKHGTDLGVYQTADDAYNAALEIAYQYWNEEVRGDVEIPDDPELVIEMYNDRTNEYLEVEHRTIAPTPLPEPSKPLRCGRCGENHEIGNCDEEEEDSGPEA